MEGLWQYTLAAKIHTGCPHFGLDYHGYWVYNEEEDQEDEGGKGVETWEKEREGGDEEKEKGRSK